MADEWIFDGELSNKEIEVLEEHNKLVEFLNGDN